MALHIYEEQELAVTVMLGLLTEYGTREPPVPIFIPLHITGECLKPPVVLPSPPFRPYGMIGEGVMKTITLGLTAVFLRHHLTQAHTIEMYG